MQFACEVSTGRCLGQRTWGSQRFGWVGDVTTTSVAAGKSAAIGLQANALRLKVFQSSAYIKDCSAASA
jgi:hypothetical protein